MCALAIHCSTRVYTRCKNKEAKRTVNCGSDRRGSWTLSAFRSPSLNGEKKKKRQRISAPSLSPPRSETRILVGGGRGNPKFGKKVFLLDKTLDRYLEIETGKRVENRKLGKGKIDRMRNSRFPGCARLKNLGDFRVQVRAKRAVLNCRDYMSCWLIYRRVWFS